MHMEVLGYALFVGPTDVATTHPIILRVESSSNKAAIHLIQRDVNRNGAILAPEIALA
jgi:hypothetical protein